MILNAVLALLLITYAFAKTIDSSRREMRYLVIALAILIIVANYVTIIISMPEASKVLLPFFILAKSDRGSVLLIDFSQIIIMIEILSRRKELSEFTIRYIKVIRSKQISREPR